MTHISESLRRNVIKRARGQCEYCQTQQAIVVEMEIDHIVPAAAGGQTTPDNLCLACISCNGFKQRFEMGLDPETGMQVNLFNPRTQVWADHFTWDAEGTHVTGLTETGRATVVRLRMNRPRIVQARRLWVQAGWHPPNS